MRIWSLHPKYLDASGLVALWRETLLAKHVLEGKTKGYKNHPQLNRFKEEDQPLERINQYLTEVYKEAVKRDYNFNKEKIDWNFRKTQMKVTQGQLNFEIEHLKRKLKIRNKELYAAFKKINQHEVHPIFLIVDGGIESWEIV